MLRARKCLKGMVTAPHHLAAEAGVSAMREGGNAIEAMIAAAAAIAVTYPHMNAIGGDGFWLIALPGRAPIGIRACGPAAGLATRQFYAAHGDAAIPARGPRAALTVAGAVAGWAEAAAVAREAGGRLPVAALLADAIRHARDGVIVTRSQAELTASKWNELEPVPGFAETYAPLGLPADGSLLKQPQLAATLTRLAEAGLGDFYRGDLARLLARRLEAAGSPLRLEDLEAFAARRVDPVSVRLAAGEIFNMPPPTQGIASLMILGIFERLGVSEAEGFAHVHGLIEATKRAFIRRNAHLGDPARMAPGWQDWLSPEILAQEAAAIDPARAAPWPHRALPGDTIWMGAADADGCVVSYIQSIFWEYGSGLVLPETGVLWQNRGASFTLADGPNALEPGRLPAHTLNPALARLADGRTLAYGTMGGEGQPQTQAAIFSRHVLFGEDMQAAVTAPRWLLGRTWGAEATNLKLESRFPPQLVEALRAAGHDVEIAGAFDDMMGHAGMVSIDAAGVISGATDPRADGALAGF
ncbi:MULTISPECIES: gamma-glutamyltransferase [Rhodomicrobium]|uniref:gamma-glutamyltransferase family protein n=1 Tax=Rhodomicrobium TaxID=1068 RepID=UPI000B4ADE92|nr:MULTISPECIES: gamma-glutamyltransferase [Rhodomicrobium]